MKKPGDTNDNFPAGLILSTQEMKFFYLHMLARFNNKNNCFINCFFRMCNNFSNDKLTNRPKKASNKIFPHPSIPK